MGVPICLAIVFFMGVGPALPWGTSSFKGALQRLGPPLIAGGIMTGGLVVGGINDPLPLLSFFVCGFAGWATMREFHEPARSRQHRTNEAYLIALWRVSRQTHRRFGGYIAHIGVIIIAIAVTASSSFKKTDEITIATSEHAEVFGYDLTYVGTHSEQQPHRSSEIATFSIRNARGSSVGVLEPRLNNYFRMGTVIGTPAVRSTFREDLYLSVIQINDQHVTLQVIVQPMVGWLWFGGAIIGFGAVFSMWPHRRRRHKPAEGAA